ncbi:MAG: peptide chain release factor N(5)-glutamine methyltransferase [Spirochaetaceae bacterium]|jgi:release factor glutamine methyltransferase|nr:peptide chain release factor N(5)-glutamine methyltransferase [Spirochaetaceae bacterium]
MTIGEALAEGTALLRSSGIENPRRDAALLLADILRTDRGGLVLAEPNPLPGAARRRFGLSLKRRLDGECVAYILGRREFWGLDFTVTAAVLVPRPDTETLVEAALSYIDHRGSPGTIRLLDLCTGSGAVAVSLKHERPDLAVTASDISPEAIKIARDNARRLLDRDGSPAGPGETRGIAFIKSDLFENIQGTFDCVTANPPYVPAKTIDTLAREVRREPRLALDGGEDGLDIIRRLIGDAKGHLSPGGVLLIEAGPGQMAAITGLLANRGYRKWDIRRDLSGEDRVIGAYV